MALDMIRVRTLWTGGVVGGGVSTHYFLATAPPNTAQAQALVDRVRDFWAQLKPAILSTNTYTVSGVCDDLNYGSGVLQTSITVTSRSDGGSGSGEQLPPANQALIRWETGQFINGKRFRGRTFIPGITETCSNGAPTGVLLTAVPAAVTAIDPTNASFPLVIWHRPLNPGPGGSGGDAKGVTSGALQGKFAVLRSRRD